jgi:hypothetical protein
VEAGASPIAAPLGLYETTVPADWLDYNGHMSEWCYLLLVGLAADAFFRFIGIDEAYRAGGHSLYTAETHLHHLREASAGDRLGVPLQLLDAGLTVPGDSERGQWISGSARQTGVASTVRDFVRRELVPHEDLVERLDAVPPSWRGSPWRPSRPACTPRTSRPSWAAAAWTPWG